MYDPDELRSQWETATHNLPWGVQRAFHNVLELVQEEKKKDLVYGADYSSQGACLVNASANMLVSHIGVGEGGGHGIPVGAFNEVVLLFDKINAFLEIQGVNSTAGLVSPLAAEILLNWYGPLKDQPDVVENYETSEGNVIPLPYIEATDEEMEEAFMTLLENRPVATPFDEIVPENEVARQE